MTNIRKELRKCVTSAIEEFNCKEQFLIKNNLSERCICSRFAFYLEREFLANGFCRYVADVEYNQGNGGNECAEKTLHGQRIYTVI